MSSKDPLVSISEGATVGALNFTVEKIKAWVAKFRNRELAFVEDVEVINLAKKQRTVSEWNLYKEYITNTDFRILFQMGLTLRSLENAPERLMSLRDRIVKKYDAKGLHIAQFIQNGFFSKYVGNIIERASTPQRLKLEIESLFNNIENTVVFVQQLDDVDIKTEEIVTKINAHSPKTFIICGSGSAMTRCEKIKKNVMKRISDYTDELYKAGNKEIYFLNRSDTSYDS